MKNWNYVVAFEQDFCKFLAKCAPSVIDNNREYVAEIGVKPKKRFLLTDARCFRRKKCQDAIISCFIRKNGLEKDHCAALLLKIKSSLLKKDRERKTEGCKQVWCFGNSCI